MNLPCRQCGCYRKINTNDDNEYSEWYNEFTTDIEISIGWFCVQCGYENDLHFDSMNDLHKFTSKVRKDTIK